MSVPAIARPIDDRDMPPPLVIGCTAGAGHARDPAAGRRHARRMRCRRCPAAAPRTGRSDSARAGRTPAADLVRQGAGQLAQHLVAGDVAVLLVVGAETVDVDHRDRDLGVMAQRPPPLAVGVGIEMRDSAGDAADLIDHRQGMVREVIGRSCLRSR